MTETVVKVLILLESPCGNGEVLFCDVGEGLSWDCCVELLLKFCLKKKLQFKFLKNRHNILKMAVENDLIFIITQQYLTCLYYWDY